MTDDEFKARFIEAFKARCTSDVSWPADLAEEEAREQYADCPRHEMLAPYVDDPEMAAHETFDDRVLDGLMDDISGVPKE